MANLSTLEGWDLAYSSRQQHEVGVIDPDLLPSKTLVYKYYFNLNPQIIAGQGSSVSLNSFLGGVSGFGGIPQVNFATDYIMFDLDFVVSKPVWNQLITATADNVSGSTLTLPLHVIDVAYVFKVTLDADGNVDEVLDASGANPVNPSTLPDQPDKDAGRDRWFTFYEEFENNGTWSSYNRFLGKQGSPDQDYTLEHKGTSNQTNSKNISVKNLAVGDHYIVSYEGIEQHLFRHHVDMTFEQIVITSFGVNLSSQYFPYERDGTSRFAHYLWKEWKDSDGKSHEGWRVSETWDMKANARHLANNNAPYDSVNNPVVGIAQGVNWAMYNMTEKNLRKKDKERIGYSKSYADYLETKAPLSALTEAAAQAADIEDGNNITLSNVHPSTFELEYVADNVVNYSGGGYGFVEQGGAQGILFKAITTQYFGYFMSNYYKRKFPKNTRMVSAYSRIQHGGNGRVIAVLMKKGGDHVSALQDPMFFMTIRDKLYFHYLDDDFGKVMTAYRMNQSSNDVAYSGNKLIGATSPGGEGTLVEPGRNILIGDNTDSAKTFNDDSKLTSSPTTDAPPTSIVKFTQVDATITDVTSSYEDKPVNAVKVFRASGMTAGSLIGALKIKIAPTDTTKSSVLLRFKGEGSQDREMYNVSIPTNKEYSIDVGAWEDMTNIYIMSDIDCSISTCKFVQLDSSIERQYHVVDEVSSMAASTTKRGNNLLFYTDRDGRINVLFTDTAGLKWGRYENILMRGDEISSVRGVPNMEDDIFFLFHFYKDALLCVPMNTTLFMIPTDSDKKVEALDNIRRQSCSLVWGKAIKPVADRATVTNGAGEKTFEDLNDNVIFTSTDRTAYQNNSRSIMQISSSNAADTSSKDMSDGNRFITIGQKTSSNGLATSEPKSTEYAVYMSKRGALRLFIEHEDSSGKTVIRNLNSFDYGLNWQDGWKFQKTDVTSTTEHVVRVNYLSDKEDSDEGTNISLLYNEVQDIVYIFYFYLGAVLCKPISDEILYKTDLDEQADIINSIPIYAVAGNLESVVGESNYETLTASSDKHVLFNYFQRNSNNLSKYYGEEYYGEQPISGYFTKGGYMRIFLVNSNSEVDGYFFDGGIWLPDKAVLI